MQWTGRPILVLFSPMWPILLQYFVLTYYLTLEWRRLNNPWRVVGYYYVPLGLYIFTVVSVFLFSRSIGIKKKGCCRYTIRPFKFPRLFSLSLIFWSVLLFLGQGTGFVILSKYYSGSVGEFFRMILLDPSFPSYVQWTLGDGPKSAKLAGLLAPLIPPVVALLFYAFVSRSCGWKRYVCIVLAAGLVLSEFIVSVSLSARMFFLSSVIPPIVIGSRFSRFRWRTLFKLGMVALLGISFIVATQVLIKPGGQYEKAKVELRNYYVLSVLNGMHVIDRSYTTESVGFWTFRPLLFAPIIHNSVQELYEQIVGPIPIKSREDDFTYAQKLGVENPSYNTFSLFGYIFLDWGYVPGIVAIFLIFFLSHWLYWKALAGSVWHLLQYAIFYFSLIDLLRTYLIASDIGFYYIVVISVAWLIAAVMDALRTQEYASKARRNTW